MVIVAFTKPTDNWGKACDNMKTIGKHRMLWVIRAQEHSKMYENGTLRRLNSVNVLQRRHYEDIAVDVVLKAAKKCLRQRLGTQRWYKSIGFSTETSCARTAQSEDTHQESTTSTNAKTRCGARWWLLVVLLLGGMWYMVYGTWYMVSSMVYGTWYVVYGMVYGIWYGIWYMVHSMNSSARRQQ